QGGFINATDMADYLVRQGLPFRSAYKISGQVVAYCIENGKVLDDLTIEELKMFSDLFDDSVFQAISLETCVSKRISKGGTSVSSVEAQLAYVKEQLKK
ncbi:MAG: argininosuccinate lyase, partial [Clostridia bacterium]|nr:argininosuccinate lyase [Clostridia bacterium]